MENPLLKSFDTPHQSIPFNNIQPEHFIPALKENIKNALVEIDEVVSQTSHPTFKNTVEALQNIGELLERNSNILFNLNSAATSEAIQEVTQQASPLLTQFQNDIRLNQALFERIRIIYENQEKENLTVEQQTLLEKEYKGFAKNGALLDENEKNILREIDTEKSQLGLTFGENVLADTQAFELHITDEKDLQGLPEQVKEMAAETAQSKDKEGWIFTLDYPSYVPLMTYSENRELRKRMSVAFGRIGFEDNDHNNTAIIMRLIELRKKRAKLLGYNSHAAFVLEERMATSEENVKTFLEDLYQKAYPAAKGEWEAMEGFAAKNLDLAKMEKWDTAYVSEKLKQAQLELDEQELKPYFPMEKVQAGVFEIAGKLYGLRFEKNDSLEGYHPRVKVYEVFNRKGDFYALLYTDFFPRRGKRNGAWMTSYRSQKKGQRPHISMVCNFSKPTESTPSLLTFQEVTTLFHEFGHALHGMLANTNYGVLSGTNVYWDFVELPSQIMENWCYEKEALELFARHYQTDEVIPMEYIHKIKKAAHFQQGLQTLRQLGFGFLDLSYHDSQATDIQDIKQHETTILNRVNFLGEYPESCSSTAFSHIFQGGYSAGYYSYKWAEVLDADAFDLFLEKGIFDAETSKSFEENILSKGGTEHPMTLYKRFR
ncbi:M3 family metallopeptidase, partial [Flavobacteriaceae bacterium]|nr:M3 family metallopeptidase [Flavobacteriaceae bacterium]